MSAGTGPVRVGLVGAGNISDEYLTSLTSYADIDVVGIADLDLERATAQAARYAVPFAASVDELLARDDLDLVVNLTIPAAHGAVALQAIAAGKHVWSEKPLSLGLEEATAVLAAATTARVEVGNAPDTILGQGIQHSQRLLDAGAIGTPQTVLTLMQGPGPDSWHPRPQFLFAEGAGPLFDIGPYYFSTLVQLLGDIESVEALGHRASEERTVGSGPDAGTVFPVGVWTHVSVLTRFRSGVVGTSIYSFDSPVRRQLFEITGSLGTMEVPVSGFDGATRILSAGETEWRTEHPPGVPRERGVGVLEMARSIRSGDTPRAGGRLAFHALEAMLAVLTSIETRSPVELSSSAGPVPSLPADWDPHASTLPAAPRHSN